MLDQDLSEMFGLFGFRGQVAKRFVRAPKRPAISLLISSLEAEQAEQMREVPLPQRFVCVRLPLTKPNKAEHQTEQAEQAEHLSYPK